MPLRRLIWLSEESRLLLKYTKRTYKTQDGTWKTYLSQWRFRVALRKLMWRHVPPLYFLRHTNCFWCHFLRLAMNKQQTNSSIEEKTQIKPRKFNYTTKLNAWRDSQPFRFSLLQKPVNRSYSSSLERRLRSKLLNYLSFLFVCVVPGLVVCISGFIYISNIEKIFTFVRKDVIKDINRYIEYKNE